MKRCIAILLPLMLLSCRSPVRSDEREELGPELPDVEPGEFHRPGQPCLRCHDSRGGEEPEMVVAGTIFATPDEKIPVAGASVTIFDANDESVSATTNCVGNFYITKDEWAAPAFPLRPVIFCPLPVGATTDPNNSIPVMDSLVHRDGACAGCHVDRPSEASAGWVYCYPQQPDVPYAVDASCPGRVP